MYELAIIITGLLTLISACGVVFSSKPLSCALSLVVTLFSVAVHFALLQAGFVAAIQVIVYAGAIMVLVIFVIMLLGQDESTFKQEIRGVIVKKRLFAALCTGLVCALLLLSIPYTDSFQFKDKSSDFVPPEFGSTASIGKALFVDYVYLFEITSLLLLSAIIGAVVIAHPDKRPLQAGRGLRATRHEASE